MLAVNKEGQLAAIGTVLKIQEFAHVEVSKDATSPLCVFPSRLASENGLEGQQCGNCHHVPETVSIPRPNTVPPECS